MVACHPAIGYTAIGDSITLGTGTLLFSPTFVDFYKNDIQCSLRKTVNLRVFAENGATTSEVKKWLSCSKIDLEQTHIVTLTAGGNDLIDAAESYAITKNDDVLEDALHVCCQNMSWIVSYLSNAINQSDAKAMIRIVNLYNPIPTIPFSDYWVKQFNRHIDKCSTGELVRVANVFPVFKGREKQLLASDCIHPNTHGHKEISNVLMKTGICL
jgi:lysophospholipase L1-like esterase